MSDLRKYINLIAETDLLAERKVRLPKKAKPRAQQKSQAKLPVNAPPSATELAARGNLLTSIIKKNPKVSAALAAIVGIKVGGTLAGSDSTAVQPQANTAPPAQDGMGAGTASGQPNSASQAPAGQDLTAMKAEIDALIKELESSGSADIKKELERIKGKLNPKPARWSDNPSIIE